MKRISEIPQETPKRNCPESNAYAEPVTTRNRDASCGNIENAANNPDETEFPTPKHLRDQVFTISLDEKNSKFATCNLCTGKTKTIKMANANTTGLKRHLEREHPKAYIDIYGAVPATLKKTGNRGRGNFSQGKFNNMLVDWAAKKYLPFSFFDDPSTQELFQYLNPNAQVPKHDGFRSKTLDRFSKMQRIVMKILHENPSKISFTVDAWTSVANKSYYGITAHFIDEQWNIQGLVLDFIPSNGCHSGRDIAAIFCESLKQHDLLSKVQGITLDNASANTKFMAELAPLMACENISFDPKNQHFRCFAHVINLAVNDMLRLIQSNIDDVDENTDESGSDNDEEVNSTDCTRVLTKLQTLFRKIKYSEQWTNKLQSCCETTNSKMQSPNLGVATRWNSVCNMIDAALQMRKALNLLCDNNANLRIYHLSETEWSLLTGLIKFLHHFKALSTALGGEKYVTLPLVVIGINMMLDKLETFILSHQVSADGSVAKVLSEGAVAARDKLIKHYLRANWTYCVILILDPRHKVETFQQTTWGKEMAKESIKQFETIYRTQYYERQMLDEPSLLSLSTNIDESSNNAPETSNNDVLDLGSLFESDTSGPIPCTNWRKELDNYLYLPRASRNENILLWWRQHEQKFPILASMARDFLSIQATSVPVERFFSKASLVIRKHRNRLNNDSARSLLCLNSWLSCSLSSKIMEKLATIHE